MTTEIKLSKRQQLKLLKDTWNKLQYRLDNITWSKIGTDYLKENINEEKRHDNYRGDSISRGITINEAGKLFAVQQIVRYLEGEKPPNINYYLSYRKSCFTAWGIVAEHKKYVEEALQGINKQHILEMDYCTLIK